MKYLIIFILLINPIIISYGQDDDYGYSEPGTTIDWSDPIYDFFFTNTLKSVKGGKTIIEYDQVVTPSAPWANDPYGLPSYCPDAKIKDWGCAMTCMAMILKNSDNDVDPGTLQSWLKNKGLDVGFNKTCGVYWGAIDVYGNKAVKFNGKYQENGKVNRLKTLIDAGGYAIANVENNGKTCHHKILVYDYTGIGTSESDFIVSDPGTTLDNLNGQPRNLKYYNLCKDSKKYDFVFYNASANSPKADFEFTFDQVKKAFFKILYDKYLKSAQTYLNFVWTITNTTTNEKFFNKVDANPEFEFPSSGKYTVSLAVQDEYGFDAIVKKECITFTTPNSSSPVNPNWTQYSNVIVTPGTVDFPDCVGIHPQCGNGICELQFGENENNCYDCLPILNIYDGYYLNYRNYDMNYVCPNTPVVINMKMCAVACGVLQWKMELPFSTTDYKYLYFLSVYSDCDDNFNCKTENRKWFSYTSLSYVPNKIYLSPSLSPDAKGFEFENGKKYLIKMARHTTPEGTGWFEITKRMEMLPDFNLDLTGNLANSKYAAQNTLTLNNCTTAKGSNINITSGNSIIINPGSVIYENVIASITPYVNTCSNLKSAIVENNESTNLSDYYSPVDKFSNNKDKLEKQKATFSKVEIYPNPNNGNFTVRIPDLELLRSIEVIDNVNRTILKSAKITDNEYEIDISSFPSGFYMVRLKYNDYSIVKKIVKL